MASEDRKGEDVEMKEDESKEETEAPKDPQAAQRDKDLLTFEGTCVGSRVRRRRTAR